MVPNGGRLRFAYLENDFDADSYQGHSYTRLYPEEMGTFATEAPINKLQATLRSGNGVPCQMKGTCNPGGPGHQWVKARYRLDANPQGMEIYRTQFTNPFTKKAIEKTRVFIPSRVTDNKYLGDDYIANLFQVGSDALVRAWLEGDWSVIDGAFFDCWSNEKHILKPVRGAGRLAALSLDGLGLGFPLQCGVVGRGRQRVRDAERCWCCRRVRWSAIANGTAQRSRTSGLKLDAEEVGKGIQEREAGDTISYGVLDPSAFAADGGPSIAERMARATERRVWFRRADNRRVGLRGAMGGWDQLRARLKGDSDDGKPMLYVFSTCRDFIRTLPALQHDKVRPEDVDTEGEDHAPDEARYACMSRPYGLLDDAHEDRHHCRTAADPARWNEMLEEFDGEQAELND